MITKTLKTLALGAGLFCALASHASHPLDDCVNSTARQYEIGNTWGTSLTQKYSGFWKIGGRRTQYIEQLNLTADPGSATLRGTVKYRGEGPIEVVATRTLGKNCYTAQVKWGDEGWQLDGNWQLGSRDDQRIQSLHLKTYYYSGHGNILAGSGHYQDEGPIGFYAYPF